MRKLIICSLALLVWAGANAQYKLSGTITESESGRPVPGATVKLISDFNLPQQYSADDGSYTFEVSEPGEYLLSVHYLGYLDFETVWNTNSGNRVIHVELERDVTMLHSIEVTTLRAEEDDPFAYTDVSAEEMVNLNSGRDVPYLLEQTPGLVAMSDAGAGVGYTNMRIRGSDITRINVTVNGIPMNDAESHGVWWVNTPDLVSSTGSMQVQRGVGTSTNGAGAFGASLNMEAGAIEDKPSAMLHLGGGSFNTLRSTLALGSGLINDHWWVSARLSRTASDGWVDRATSDLRSHFVSMGYTKNGTTLRAVYFGGGQQTYQAWNGVDSATYATDPTFNSAGAIYDENWNVIDFYDNETDNYKQDHFQLHWNQNIGDYWSLNLSGHYTYGRGFYEQYRQNEYMPDYGISPVIIGNDTISTTDLIRRKWLDNDFYGGIYNLTYSKNKLNVVLGGGFHQYEGRHFGEVIWARYASDSEIRDRYYESYSNKTDFNTYLKGSYWFSEDFRGFVDLQVRSVRYVAHGTDDDAGAFRFSQDNLFFNPKLGLSYLINEQLRTFVSYSVANKEPNRTDLLYADPDNLSKPERLQDVEIGVDLFRSGFELQANLFYMYYTNQLVLTGEIDPVGYPIRENVGRSYRSGIELIWNAEITPWFIWIGNTSLSTNRNIDFKEDLGNGEVNDLGNTNIAYSPNIILASTLRFTPFTNASIEWFSKYVGEQYLSNTDNSRHILDAYFVNDLRLSYILRPSKNGQVRLYFNIQNLLDVKYAANGYTWGPYPYYYPQAGMNVLGGIQIDL